MVLVATLLIVNAAIAVVLWPLFRAKPTTTVGQTWQRDRLDALLSQRDSAYDAIRELGFEYQLGNLSEEDYLELRERYREGAADVLRRLERLDGTRPSADDREERLSRTRDISSTTCPRCGKPSREMSRQCERCGGFLEMNHET